MGRIYLRNELDEDDRVEEIAEALNRDVLDVVGRLWKLWSHADKHSRNGFLPHATRARVDKLVRLDGFAVTLEKAGWLVVTDEGIAIPRYGEHCGQSQKRRRIDRVRKQRQRDRQRELSRERPADVPRDTLRTSRGNPQSSTANASASAPALSLEALTLSALEKNQEPDLPLPIAVRMSLWIADIRRVTTETDHDPLYRVICAYMPELDWRRALSETAAMGATAEHPGKVFTARCMEIAAEKGIALPIGKRRELQRATG